MQEERRPGAAARGEPGRGDEGDHCGGDQDHGAGEQSELSQIWRIMRNIVSSFKISSDITSYLNIICLFMYAIISQQIKNLTINNGTLHNVV